MNEADGFRIEAACQFGFETTNDDADEYKCNEAALIAFAKACERKGMADAREIAKDIEANRHVSHFVRDFQAGFKHGAFVVSKRLDEQITTIQAELAPIVEAERQRFLTARGHVPIDPANPQGGWVKP